MIARRLMLAAPLLPFAARAQGGDAFPSRPLRATVPFPPGSATDGIARFVGERISRSLGLVSSTGTPEDLAAFQAREIEQWGRIAQAAGLPRE